MVDERGWCRQAQVRAGRQFLCWTALWPERSRLRGAACACIPPASCCTLPEPAAPPVPACRACPLGSRETTTQLSRVCVCVLGWHFLMRFQRFARSASLSGTNYALKEQFTFMIQTICTAELQKRKERREKKALVSNKNNLDTTTLWIPQAECANVWNFTAALTVLFWPELQSQQRQLRRANQRDTLELEIWLN